MSIITSWAGKWSCRLHLGRVWAGTNLRRRSAFFIVEGTLQLQTRYGPYVSFYGNAPPDAGPALAWIAIMLVIVSTMALMRGV